MCSENLDKTWFRFIGNFWVLAALGASIPPLNAQGPGASLSVNTSTVIQSDFLGVNAVYHGFAFMPEQIQKGMSDADRGREFDRVWRIGLNLARTWSSVIAVCGNSRTLPS